MIRRISHRTHDDARDVTLLRLECGHAVETRALVRGFAECEHCARERAQDLLRGGYGAALRMLVDRACAGGSLAAQMEMVTE